jgi:hypothetical protein
LMYGSRIGDSEAEIRQKLVSAAGLGGVLDFLGETTRFIRLVLHLSSNVLDYESREPG